MSNRDSLQEIKLFSLFYELETQTAKPELVLMSSYSSNDFFGPIFGRIDVDVYGKFVLRKDLDNPVFN
jgi:hypothetical protein